MYHIIMVKRIGISDNDLVASRYLFFSTTYQTFCLSQHLVCCQIAVIDNQMIDYLT